MSSAQSSPQEQHLWTYINQLVPEVIEIFGKASRSPSQCFYRYATRLRFANTANPPQTTDQIRSQLTPLIAAHPEARFVPIVDDNWIDIEISVKATARVSPFVTEQLNSKGTSLTPTDIKLLANIASLIAVTLGDDPAWQEITAAIANKCNILSALLVPPGEKASGCVSLNKWFGKG